MKKLIRFSSALIAALFVSTVAAPAVSAQIIINETMVEPVTIAAANGQWIELVNTGANPVSIDGWEIDGATIDMDTPIASGAKAIICRNPDVAQNGNVACDGTANFELDPAGQTITLLDETSQPIDDFTYTSGDVATGTAIEAIQTSTTAEAQTTNGTGTPGANNDQPANTVRNDRTGVVYATIQSAIDAAEAGDTLHAAAGTYQENVVITKAVNLVGANKNTTIITAANNTGGTSTVFFNHGTTGASVRNFTITHTYSNAELAAWDFNNNGVSFGQLTSGHTLENCIVTLSRNGVYLNNNQSNTITGNTITNNRTGINMTNDLAGTVISNNTISNNWTVGLVSYFSSYTTNYSSITVTGNTFDQNWYSEVLIKDTGASTGSLNLTNNTFTDSPVTYTTTTSSSFNEPGFADLKPVALGGSATKPSTDLPTLRIYNSNATIAYAAPKTLRVGSTQPYTSIQTAINEASAGDTVTIDAGTFSEAITVNKALTLRGAGDTAGTGTIIDQNQSNGILVEASNVTLRGLRIQKQSTGNGIQITSVSTTGLVLDDITTSGAVNGLRVGSGISVDGLTVTNSHFDGNTHGWYIAKETVGSASAVFTNITVTNSSFDNNTNKGLYAEKLSNATFTNVTVNNSGTNGSYSVNAGIDINLKWSAYSNLTFTNITLNNSGLQGTAVDPIVPVAFTVKARSDGSYGSSPATLTNVTLNNVTVNGGVNGLRFGEPAKNNAGPTNVTVVNSSFTNLSNKAIVNETTATVVATSNWWGCNAGPANAACEGISGSVTYDPWVGNEATYIVEDDITPVVNDPGEAVLPSNKDVFEFSNNTVLNVSQNTTPTSTLVVEGNSVSTTQTIGGVSVAVEKVVTIQSGNSSPVTLVNTAAPTIKVELPATVGVYASNTWDGIIKPPTIVTPASTESAPSGFTFGDKVLKVGSDDTTLIFDEVVTLTLEGVTGSVGYKAAGSNTWNLIATCGGTYASPVLPTFPGECAISNGTDTKILTYHFTTFAALTQVADGTPATTSSSTSQATNQTSTGSRRSAAAASSNDIAGTVASEQAGTSSTETEQVAQTADNGIAAELGDGNGLTWWQWSIIGLTVIGMLYYLAGDQIRQKLTK